MDELDQLNRPVIGFYWTLPVPWAAFTNIDHHDIDKAAQQSRTIALQREVIRNWAKIERRKLIAEKVYLEVAPDRGGKEIGEPLMTLVHKARAEGARIAFVDFAAAIQQRSHLILRDLVGAQADVFEPILPAEPHLAAFRQHFKYWKEEQARWTDGKPEREMAAKARAMQLRAQDLPYQSIAQQLNAEGLKSVTGKLWTGDNIGKLLKKE